MLARRNRTRAAVYSITCLLLLSCGGPRVFIGEYDHLRPSLVAAAMAMRGKPYRYGGTSPDGFDCSGLVVYSYKQFDIDIPRNSYKQYKASKIIYEQDLKPGDLVFFRTNSSFVSHVGIYVGNNRFVHAPGKGKTVRVDSMDDDYYRKRFVGAGTFL
ncbi:MAG: C40 family peptidase [Gammaproteobacteria bacterium]|nr:C40 family peptidase [Gammaproteobacteria bacterium]